MIAEIAFSISQIVVVGVCLYFIGAVTGYLLGREGK